MIRARRTVKNLALFFIQIDCFTIERVYIFFLPFALNSTNMRDKFVLSEEILKIQEDDIANYYIVNETEIRGKSDQDLARYLNGKKS